MTDLLNSRLQTTNTPGCKQRASVLGSLVFALTLLCCQAARAAEHEIPLFISASNAMQEGFARIVNHSDASGTVSIRAFDDSGRAFGPTTLSLNAWEAKHFNSEDLEMGSSSKGISGIGGGMGDWRLVLESDLDIEVLAYVRTTDGFLTSVHDKVRQPSSRHLVPIFNPGSNRNQVSKLRLINPGSGAAAVTIVGADDSGRRPPEIGLRLPAGEVRTFTAQQLEAGHGDLDGRLGDRSGKWRLFVSADRPIGVMSLLETPTGHLANLSTSTSVKNYAPPPGGDPDTGAEGFAPADQAAFDALVVGKRMESDDPNGYIDFVSAGRFRETEGSDVWTGRYAYTNTGPDTATVTLNYDDGDRCTYRATFAATTSGSATFTCSDGASGSTGWRIAETPPQPPTGTDPYERLDTLEVSPGRVQFSFFSAGRCISISNTTINGVTYTIESSKWQRRADANSAWADVADTEESGQICSLNPSESGEYRLVAEITIDGSTGMYASNTMIVN